jgi:anti-anti-sigma regulatory factor
MLRITETEAGQTLELRLDGTVDIQAFADLEAAWSRPDQVAAMNVILDMGGVVFMSDDAARKLAQLASDRLSATNCSPFIAALLQSVAR